MSQTRVFPCWALPLALDVVSEVLDVDGNRQIDRRDFRCGAAFDAFADLVERTAAYERGPRYLPPSAYLGKTVVIDPALERADAIATWAKELSGRETSRTLRKRCRSVVVVSTGSPMHSKAIRRQVAGEAIDIVSRAQLSDALMSRRAGHRDFADLESFAGRFLIAHIAPAMGWKGARIVHGRDATGDWYRPFKAALVERRGNTSLNDVVKVELSVRCGRDTPTVALALDRRSGEVLEVYLAGGRHEPTAFPAPGGCRTR